MDKSLEHPECGNALSSCIRSSGALHLAQKGGLLHSCDCQVLDLQLHTYCAIRTRMSHLTNKIQDYSPNQLKFAKSNFKKHFPVTVDIVKGFHETPAEVSFSTQDATRTLLGFVWKQDFQLGS